MGQQPSIPTDLSREVQVIGAGFSRTGTVSFALALEKLLQGPVCHSGTAILMREEGRLALSQKYLYLHLINHVIEYVQKWIAIQERGADEKLIDKNLRELTAGYVATTDTPCVQFTGDLAKIYPNAVVICSTRDQASWWKSAQALYANTGLWWLDIVFWPMPTLRYFGRWRDTIGDR